MGICKVTVCDREASLLGYCKPHYKRFRRSGVHPTTMVRPPRTDNSCLVSGCPRLHYGLGYCKGHYRRLREGKELSVGFRPQILHGASSPSASKELRYTYQSWRSMHNRCEQKTHPSYKDYGGRVIVVCDRWGDFNLFLEDMGIRPDGLSIDRIDNEKGYEPGNCRWATASMQNKNKRHKVSA